jgi:ATP-binding cassette subfamily C protein LapB
MPEMQTMSARTLPHASHETHGSPETKTIRGLFKNPELRRVLPGLIVSAFLANLLALPLPLAILQILDRVIVNQTLSTLAFLTVGLVAAILLEQVLRFANGVITSWLTARQEHQATLAVVDHLLKVRLQDYQREEPSAYAEKLQGANRVARFHSGEAILALLDLPFVFLFILLIWLIGGQLVVVPLTILLIFTVLMARYGRSRQSESVQKSSHDERRFGFLAEIFSGIHSVKTMMMGKLMVRRYERLQRATAEAGEQVAYLNERLDRVGHYFSQLMVVSIVFVGAWYVIEGDLTPGALAACLILSIRLMTPLRRSLNVKVQIDEYERANERLQSLLRVPLVEKPGKPPLPVIRQGVELRDVQVRYHDRPVLNALNLVIEKNRCIAIESASGSGKTTLLNLLCGLEQPESGQVLVDGTPLSEFAATSVHRHIGLLPQNGVVVSGTILENLTMFDRDLTERALEVSKDLGLDKFVARMRLGYETRVGGSANEVLSAGTRQLITIVRALVYEPEVILFDEANVALDADTDESVRSYLAGLKGKHAIVLVTHRPSYLSLADQVYHFEGGALREGRPAKARNVEQTLAEQPRPPAAIGPEHIIREHFPDPNDLSRCLLPLLGALEWEGGQRDLAEALPHFETSLDLSSFLSVVVDLGFRPARIGRLNHEPDDRLFPSLFLPESGLAKIVLNRTNDGDLRVFSGEDGSISTVENLNPAVGDYYTFRKAIPGNEDNFHRSWFNALVDRFKRHRRIILLLTIVATILSIAPPLFVRATWDFVIPVGDISIGFYLLLGAGIAIMLGWLLSAARARLLGYIGGRVDYVLGINLVQRVLELPSSAVDSVPVNRQIRRIRGLTRIREYFVGPIARLAFDMPATLILVAALIVINPWMIVVLAVAIVAFGLLALLRFHKSQRLTDQVSAQHSARTEFLEELLNVTRVIRQTGSESKWLERLRELSARAALSVFRERQFNLAARGFSQVIASLTGLSALVVSAFLAIKGEISNGTLIATLILIWRITGPLQNSFLAATAAVKVKENVRQMNNLMRLTTEEGQGVRQSLRPESPGGLELSRVSFRYSNTADPSLLGVNLKVEPKEFVAISGHSGAGKSTLLKIIMRIYVPQAGGVRLDDVDIRQLTATDLRARISYLPQVCDVFYGTVAQNIRLAHPSATAEEVRWSAEMAGVVDEAESLPDGLETRISRSRMVELPSGFRYRLSLARAVLKPAPVVLMDEPETGMDEKGEAAFLRCIEWLRGRATVIVVTLRPSHLRLADRVVYFQGGRIAAIGRYDQVQKTLSTGSR